MGEEKKDELKENKEEKIEPVVLKVDLHCLGCASKVKKSIKTFNGVEDVWFDYTLNKVIVKGNVDPSKLRERVQKKSGRTTELLSPSPKKENVEEKEKVEDKGKDTKAEPVALTVVLKVWMHCESCAQQVRRIILKMKGVQEVSADFTANRVIVKGLIEPKKLVDYVYRKTGKHAQVVQPLPLPPPPPPQKAEEEGEKKKGGEEVKKEEDKKQEEKKDDGEKKEGEEKKEEANTDDKKGSETTEGVEAKKEDEKAEGEEKKDEEEKKNGGEETAIVTTLEEKKNEFSAPKYVIEHVYPPQIFSDENPNACSIM